MKPETAERWMVWFGMASLVGGVYLLSLPAALIVFGVIAIGAAAGSRAERRRGGK